MDNFLIDESLIDMICKSKMVPQSPTRVCAKCYLEADTNYNTQWLSWLECAQPNDHEQEDKKIIVIGDDHEVIELRELPSCRMALQPTQLSLCRNINLPAGCPFDDSCTFAHSNEELEYWKWSSIHQQMEKVQI